MNETTSGSIACQGSGFNPCPWQGYADVTLVCPAGQLLACSNPCARAIYNLAPTLYQVEPLFMYGDTYDTAREFAGLPPAPPDPPLPAPQPVMAMAGQGGIRGLLAQYLGWRRTTAGQLAETAALTGVAWELHERHKRMDERNTYSAMGWAREDREALAWQRRHSHGG
jgi:hypothetical protein